MTATDVALLFSMPVAAALIAVGAYYFTRPQAR